LSKEIRAESFLAFAEPCELIGKSHHSLELPTNQNLIGVPLPGDRRNNEVRVRIRSEMEQKMGGTIGKPVLVTKIRKA
jgi:hypothetical protein